MPKSFVRGWTKHLAPPVPGWQRTDPLDRGLVGEWRFDENTGLLLPDYSGYGNHGTVDGADWIVSERGPGLHFIAANTDFVDVGAERIGGTGLFCAAGERFTVEATFRQNTGSPGTIIARAGAVAADRTLQLFFSAETPAIILRGTRTDTGLNLDDNNFHTVCVTWDETTARFYSDGRFILNLPVGTAAEDVGQRIIFGARTNGTGYFLQLGDIFNVRIHDRDLSAAEVRARYQICLKRARPLTHVWMMPWGKVPFAIVTGDASISGSGALAASGYGIVLASAPIAGSGDVAASAYGIVPGTAALTGEGALAASGLGLVLAAASVGGSGTLTASALAVVLAAAGIAGEGVLAASGLGIVSGIAALSGSGTLSAAGLGIVLGTAPLSGTGDISAAASLIVFGDGTLAGDGTLVASVLLIISGAAALSGAGALIASGNILGEIVEGAATLSGAGALSAAGHIRVDRYYIVDAEERTWTISGETRIYVVDAESRTLEA